MYFNTYVNRNLYTVILYVHTYINMYSQSTKHFTDVRQVSHTEQEKPLRIKTKN